MTDAGGDAPGARFRILGPLEARIDERPAAVGGPKQRALLGVMLLRANHVVSVDQLIDALWHDAPIATATAQVQSRISALRQLLDGGHRSRDMIVTRPPGYLIRLAPAQLDLLVFEERVARARAAVAEGRPSDAAELFRSALRLWRGDALGDVHAPAVRAGAARLTNRRLSVQEELIEAELDLGRYAGVVGELEALTEQHPHRERLRGQLMVALHRSGRRADALGVARETRRMLSDELGMDPSPALQELERAILADGHGPAPGLASERAPAARAAPASPRQLPADTEDFTGRERQAQAVAHLLVAGAEGRGPGVAPVVVVSGAPGTGKSALAIHVAHRLADRFPDGQLYADLHDSGAAPVDPGQVLAGHLRALGLDAREIPWSLDERAALFRTVLAGRRLLIVLDGARDAVQARLLLPGAGGCAVLVTARPPLADLPGARHVDLDPFELDEALDLLARIAGAGRVLAEPLPAREIVRACGRLPLAVRLVGARLAARPAWELRTLAAQLAGPPRARLDALEHGTLSVRDRLVAACRVLDAQTRRAFRLLALLDVPIIDVAVAADALGRPADEAERLLERLVDVRLLESPRAGRYRYHELVRAFARSLAAGEDAAGPGAASRSIGPACARTECLAPGRARSAGSCARTGSAWA